MVSKGVREIPDDHPDYGFMYTPLAIAAFDQLNDCVQEAYVMMPELDDILSSIVDDPTVDIYNSASLNIINSTSFKREHNSFLA